MSFPRLTGRSIWLKEQQRAAVQPKVEPEPQLTAGDSKFYTLQNIPERFKNLRKSEDLDRVPEERVSTGTTFELYTNTYILSPPGALALHIYHLFFEEVVKTKGERIFLANQLEICKPKRTSYGGYGLLFVKLWPNERATNGEQVVTTRDKVNSVVRWEHRGEIVGNKVAYESSQEAATHQTVWSEGFLKDALTQVGLTRMDGAYYDLNRIRALNISANLPQYEAVRGIEADIELRRSGMTMTVSLKTKFLAKGTVAGQILRFQKQYEYGSPQHIAACEENLLNKQLKPSYGSTRLYKIKAFTKEKVTFFVKSKEGRKEYDPYTYLQMVSFNPRKCRTKQLDRELRTRQPE